RYTNEMYVGGMSSSLPEDVQHEMYRTVPGLEHVKIVRNAYAIEYDCSDPTQLYPTLEFKDIHGLYGAGQFNGSSGYEEAAAQGLVAGINAALKIQEKSEFVLTRDESYIGTLIDDLVTKGTNEPYRIMTSRSEYRLYLRQDNTNVRLMKKGYQIGLVSDEIYNAFLKDEALVQSEIHRISSTSIPCGEALNSLLERCGYEKIDCGMRKNELLKRPYITIKDIYSLDGTKDIPMHIQNRVETEIKYEGYIKKQLAEIEHFRTLEKKLIPKDVDYSNILGIRIEARQKLEKFRPQSIGQASRISGISPADISVLLIYLSTK
ncbi:MAG: FAD-dependent oxidoreductase, partial [Clostridia bacterium]